MTISEQIKVLCVRSNISVAELARRMGTTPQNFNSKMKRAEQQQEPVTMDDVAGMVAGQLGQLVPMDEETAEQFRQLAKKMMEQAGGTQNEEEP